MKKTKKKPEIYYIDEKITEESEKAIEKFLDKKVKDLPQKYYSK